MPTGPNRSVPPMALPKVVAVCVVSTASEGLVSVPSSLKGFASSGTAREMLISPSWASASPAAGWPPAQP
jgi:hypothetical protein